MRRSPAPAVALRRVLGRADLFALAFGAMIGWGWVVLAGDMIDLAGTLGSALAFGVGAGMVLLVGLAYAELTPALARAGGELAFTFAGLGARVAFLSGWTLILAYMAVCAFEAVALPTVARYLVGEFGGAPLWTIAGWPVTMPWVAIGVAGALLIGVVNYFGVRLASVVQTAAALLMLGVGLALFVPAAFTGSVSNMEPLFTNATGFFRVVMMTPFLFLGFDVIPQVAEEVDVPARAVGRLILVSIVIALLWYAAVQITVGLSLSRAQQAAGELPTADAMVAVWGSAAAGRVLVFAGLLGIITSWNACFLGASRLVFAMARGGMLPAAFARLHPRYRTPTHTIVALTLLTCAAPLLGRPALVWLVNAGGLAAVFGFFLVALSFIRLRHRAPDLPRPYRVPHAAVIGPLAVAVTLAFFLLYLPGSPSALRWPHEWLIIIGWIVLGGVFGVGAERRRRALGRAQQARLLLGDLAERVFATVE
jgi:amino acid transporter